MKEVRIKKIEENTMFNFEGKKKSSILVNENYLMALEKVFNTVGVPTNYYSMEGYSEDAVCIDYEMNHWVVYNGEKGNKYNLKCYESIIKACNDMILRVSESEEDSRNIQKLFVQSISKNKEINAPEIWIILLTEEINEIAENLKNNKKDYHSRRRLLKLVGQRRALLAYLKKIDISRYAELLEQLGLK